MPKEPETVTREVPAHLMEQLSAASDDLAIAEREEGAAAAQLKDARGELKKCQGLFNASANALVHPLVDGFPEDTPMAEETSDTPPDDDEGPDEAELNENHQHHADSVAEAEDLDPDDPGDNDLDDFGGE